MSQPQNSSTSWETIAGDVVAVVTALAPFASAAFPEAALALGVATKLLQGALALEPEAVALINQIKSGTPPTPAQLQQFDANYEAAYQKLKSDLAAKIAALPATS